MNLRTLTRVAFVLTGMMAATASARPEYYIAFLNKYPSTTLDIRMQDLTGSACNACHAPPNVNAVGTCYRDDMEVLLDGGATIEQALDQLDAADSDGDGVSNGGEILSTRDDDPSEVGYHPGLIGPTGTDPCGAVPAAAVSGALETPPAFVPATADLPLALLMLVTVTAGVLLIRSAVPRRAQG